MATWNYIQSTRARAMPMDPNRLRSDELILVPPDVAPLEPAELSPPRNEIVASATKTVVVTVRALSTVKVSVLVTVLVTVLVVTPPATGPPVPVDPGTTGNPGVPAQAELKAAEKKVNPLG